MKFTIGCDPEFFLKSDKGYVSSVGIVEGTKDEPLQLGGGAFVMQDNVAIEFGMPPAGSEDEWLKNLSSAYVELEQYLPEHLRLDCTPSAEFPETELQTPEACEFGCDPDYNAWTKKMNQPPRATKTNFRSCGGHIHVGFVEGTKADFLLNRMGKANTIRMMDAFHGVTSIILDDSPESRDRRRLYGKAGCYRETDYGVEYRTLSNFWMKSPVLQKLMYRLTDEVLTHMMDDYKTSAMFVGKNGKLIQHIINKGDVPGANRFCDEMTFNMWSGATQKAYIQALATV